MLVDITPFLTYIRSEYLYDRSQGFGYFSEGTVFGISVSKGEPIVFQAMIDDTTLFSNIPVAALANSKTAPKETSDFSDIAPDDIASIIQHEYLISIGFCGVWSSPEENQKGNYVLTVDFPRAKLQLHLIELDDGNYVFAPNDKLTWGEENAELPKYSRE